MNQSFEMQILQRRLTQLERVLMGSLTFSFVALCVSLVAIGLAIWALV